MGDPARIKKSILPVRFFVRNSWRVDLPPQFPSFRLAICWIDWFSVLCSIRYLSIYFKAHNLYFSYNRSLRFALLRNGSWIRCLVQKSVLQESKRRIMASWSCNVQGLNALTVNYEAYIAAGFWWRRTWNCCCPQCQECWCNCEVSSTCPIFVLINLFWVF